jgi:hypothetical protein
MTLRIWIYCIGICLLASTTHAGDAPSGEPKVVGGMSIVGNDEAPKSLAIVPWKESRVGDSLDFSSNLGDGRDFVDKDVFLRELDYYQIRVGEN